MQDLYLNISEELSKNITKKYSTSFSMASSLFAKEIRQDIYNIYGFVRIADEVVDTYSGYDAREIIDAIEQQIIGDLKRKYSYNPVFHAFTNTCNKYGIGIDLIKPFLDSMRMDTEKYINTNSNYQKYIYGSAEVVGLMCLKVFVIGNDKEYLSLEEGAKSLGSAFQKVNFLRDLKDDNEKLKRYYFPIGNYKEFNDEIKNQIILDIENDFKLAINAIEKLPESAKPAVKAAYMYYLSLLESIKSVPAEKIKQSRIRISNLSKLILLLKVKLGIL